MAYSGDGEPEYIDDEEYFDPDALGGSGRAGSNVLGGSGSRQPRGTFAEPPEDLAQGGDFAGDAPPQSGKRERKASKPGRQRGKARNPAPSVASSEERRARLAGKHDLKARQPAGEKQPDDGLAQADASKPRMGGLRQRFSRVDNSDLNAAEAVKSGKPSRMARAARGIAGRIGSLRGRHGRTDSGGSSTGARRGNAQQPPARRSPSASQASATPNEGMTVGRPGGSKAPKIASDGWLNFDRKLDMIGVALVFGAIVFVFSALSPEQAAIGGLHNIVGQLLGWGAIAVPVTMFAVGLWLIIRHFGDEPPIIDPVRLSGACLAFLSALVMFQFIDSLGYPENCGMDCIGTAVQQAYQAGRGGGLLGGWLYSALVNSLTELGGFVLVLMTLTIAAMLSTRSSMLELATVAISLSRNVRTRVSQALIQRRAQRLSAEQKQLEMSQAESQVRVRKPQPAQLGAASPPSPALPAPSSDWMPLPNRLRAFFARGAPAALTHSAETVDMEASAQSQDSGFMKRLMSRKKVADRPESSNAGNLARAGRLERFLNLGDDLPPPAAGKPAANLSSTAPMQSQAKPAPPVISGYGRSTIEPAESNPEPPPLIAPPSSSVIGRAAPPAPADSASSALPASEAGENSAPPAAKADGMTAPTKPAEPRVKDKPSIAGRDGAIASLPAAASQKPGARSNWDMPDYHELLSAGTAGELDRDALQLQAQIIEETLTSFGAPGRVVEVNSGPVITQYGVEPAYITAKTGKRNRVKVGAIAKLDKDLQLALGARSLRMEAPVPGKGYVGIEVPNPASARVGLRDVMDSSDYQKIDSPLAIALGMSVDGKPVAADLTQMPHMLIAGTTGSGKSVCVNAIINSILANNSPETVRFIMVDPKRVELTGYNGLPHLVAPVVVELERILGVLRWVTSEMDERYKTFSRAGARNIIDYNQILDPHLPAMPYIVVIIDELADLMMMAPDDTERAIARIAALARATGIHLVIATQRPSVDVVTGLIKANCPARIAFAVASSIDSRVIIDQPGAERLLGKGDMLYLSGDTPAPQRVQGVHVSNEEIQRISRYWMLQKSGIAGIEPIPLPPAAPSDTASSETKAAPDQGGQAALWNMTPPQGKADEAGNSLPEQHEDELYQKAVDMVRRLDKASVSLLQRRLRIGYTRAARLVDMMEERGVVGPPKEGSSKPRDVLPQ